MSDHGGLHRRAFLQQSGLTALFGATGITPLAFAADQSRGAATRPARFDFDTVYSRIGTDCTKWDQQLRVFGKDSVAVGMGIADMDFPAAPCITEALARRLQHHNWGYLTMPESMNRSIVDWNRRRYGAEIDPSLMMLSTGVHSGLISALLAFSPPGSKVLLQSPTYDAFYTLDIATAKCRAEENPLTLVNGRYQMDFEDLERRIDHDTHVLILCNPQNPTGNCWSREDLMTLGEICTKRRVVVFADEIHCDFVNAGHKYVPYSTLPDERIVRNSITFKSASKSFGLAAMKCAYLFSTNPEYMARVKNAGHRQDINTLGVVAHQAAYEQGDEWLDQVVAYIDGNLTFAEQYVREHIPMLGLVKPQGTYLAWVDVSRVAEHIGAADVAARANRDKAPGAAIVTPEKVVERYFVKHARVHLNAGSNYGRGGEGRMRMNVATSRKLVELALRNLADVLRQPPSATADDAAL
jgi:cysteine-S-conjugate beta-lyase